MNCFQHVEKIEFMITNACTGRCKHCSQGDHSSCGTVLEKESAVRAVKEAASRFSLQQVMTFGGEPLLYPSVVYAIHNAAREAGVPCRCLITNGYFTKDLQKAREVAMELARCGVNRVLLSVDAFHQETIPTEPVFQFALALLKENVPVFTQPAWLVSKEDDNPYNRETKGILKIFANEGIGENSGNVIFPEGNALHYLSDYFQGELPQNPYRENPLDIRCLSVDWNGDLLQGNLYRQTLTEIIETYP